MARREPKTTKALEVSVMFEPSHVAPACVVQAYGRVVPITRGAHLHPGITPVLVVRGPCNVWEVRKHDEQNAGSRVCTRLC